MWEFLWDNFRFQRHQVCGGHDGHSVEVWGKPPFCPFLWGIWQDKKPMMTVSPHKDCKGAKWWSVSSDPPLQQWGLGGRPVWCPLPLHSRAWENDGTEMVGPCCGDSWTEEYWALLQLLPVAITQQPDSVPGSCLCNSVNLLQPASVFALYLQLDHCTQEIWKTCQELSCTGEKKEWCKRNLIKILQCRIWDHLLHVTSKRGKLQWFALLLRLSHPLLLGYLQSYCVILPIKHVWVHVPFLSLIGKQLGHLLRK